MGERDVEQLEIRQPKEMAGKHHREGWEEKPQTRIILLTSVTPRIGSIDL